MSDKHTPGPWRLGGVKEFSPIGRCREIVADDGKIGLIYGTTDEDCKANADLAAAAPDLLEACREMLKEMQVWEHELGTHPAATQAIAAIKKATGE